MANIGKLDDCRMFAANDYIAPKKTRGTHSVFVEICFSWRFLLQSWANVEPLPGMQGFVSWHQRGCFSQLVSIPALHNMCVSFNVSLYRRSVPDLIVGSAKSTSF